MKVFLDVGAHTGQTLAAALRWDFDRIVCFEPAKVNHAALRELADKRTELHRYGLWNRTGKQMLHHIGTQGASLWERPNRPTGGEVCKFVRVSDWLRHNIADGDIVWMKMNVEGAELDIITDMLDTEEFKRVSFLEVMWDAHKIPAVAGRLDEVRDRLEWLYRPPRVINSKLVPKAATHIERIDNWLTMTKKVSRKS